jgi:hypothetical protein
MNVPIGDVNGGQWHCDVDCNCPMCPVNELLGVSTGTLKHPTVTGALWSFHIYNYFRATTIANRHVSVVWWLPSRDLRWPVFFCCFRVLDQLRSGDFTPDLWLGLSFIALRRDRFWQYTPRRCRWSCCWWGFCLRAKPLIPAKQAKIFAVAITAKVNLREVELPYGLLFAPLIVAPRRRGSILMSWNFDYCRLVPPESITLTQWDWTFTVFECDI